MVSRVEKKPTLSQDGDKDPKIYTLIFSILKEKIKLMPKEIDKDIYNVNAEDLAKFRRFSQRLFLDVWALCSDYKL